MLCVLNSLLIVTWELHDLHPDVVRVLADELHACSLELGHVFGIYLVPKLFVYNVQGKGKTIILIFDLGSIYLWSNGICDNAMSSSY